MLFAPAGAHLRHTGRGKSEETAQVGGKLARARVFPFAWNTDFSRHTVEYDEIFSGGVPRDGIPAINNPVFTNPEAADQWLDAQEPVIALDIGGDARAYPLQILTYHEIVNDQVGGVAVAITFCPLCNSAIAFERTLEGVTFDFGVTGNLRNSDLIMFDRQTESWWQQLTGEAIVGRLAGRRLKLRPAPIVAWEDFKTANPEGMVLSRETGYTRPYGRNPYRGYDRVDSSPILFRGDPDDRLLPKERVAAVTIGDADAAFSFMDLELERVVNYSLNGRDLVIFFKPGTLSALDQLVIAESRDVGATGVFDPHLDGRKLTFRPEDETFVDNETGSVWNILGQAVQGELAGAQLEPIVHGTHLWFAWAAFKPDTRIYQKAE